MNNLVELDGNIILFNSQYSNLYYIDNLILSIINSRKNEKYDVVVIDTYEVVFAEKYSKITSRQLTYSTHEELDRLQWIGMPKIEEDDNEEGEDEVVEVIETHEDEIASNHDTIMYFSTPDELTNRVVMNTIMNKKRDDIIIIDVKNNNALRVAVKKYADYIQSTNCKSGTKLIGKHGDITLPKK